MTARSGPYQTGVRHSRDIWDLQWIPTRAWVWIEGEYCHSDVTWRRRHYYLAQVRALPGPRGYVPLLIGPCQVPEGTPSV